jgi:hypothetical protein
MTPDVRVRLDPWEPEYEGAIQIVLDEEDAEVDLHVEARAWATIQPVTVWGPGKLYFVDGVRRIEHRILVETKDRTLFGLFGSFAVGAVEVDGAATIVQQRVERLCVVGGGLEPDPWSIPLATGSAVLTFFPLAVAENAVEVPLQGLHNSMREGEAILAQSLSTGDTVVFLDGPLTFFTASRLPVVGLVKRFQRSYLPADKAVLLRTLGVGQRTPMFLIKDTRHHRYSWYCRIAVGRVIDSSLTGIVRLEISGSLDLEKARQLADSSTLILPRFASAMGHDPRAPQNLYPIGGLESSLRHMMGDHRIVRRAIEAHIYSLEIAA